MIDVTHKNSLPGKPEIPYMREATIIPLCREANIKNVIEFSKAVRKTKISLGLRPHLIRIHPSYRLLPRFTTVM
jgi:hypothetical protein